MAGLSHQLTSLVQAEDCPELYCYVALHIGAHVPLDDSFFGRTIRKIQRKMVKKLFTHRLRSKEPPALEKAIREGQPLDKAIRDPEGDRIAQRRQLERLLDLVRLQQERELLDELVRQLAQEKPDFLCEKLRDPSPAVRWLTIQAIARRRLPLEKAVIERLDDPDRAVAQAARAALVRLGRGIDFGPKPTATKTQRQQATQRWLTWLDLQEKAVLPSKAPPSMLAEGEALPAPAIE
jgi:hypothetical protein